MLFPRFEPETHRLLIHLDNHYAMETNTNYRLK